jgi:drug/metabolite transporter (DMT)-like permease
LVSLGQLALGQLVSAQLASAQLEGERLVPVGFSLVAALCWGTSDFSGGYASRRSDAFLVTLLSHVGGFILMLTLALATHADFPSRSSQLWAAAAGLSGGVALIIFYRALSQGMGLTAPVAAVIGAAIPAAFTMTVQGLPGPLAISGFLLAGLGIWLISRPDGSGDSRGILMAVLAGMGFSGFFLCISRTGNSSALWSSAFSRMASMFFVGAIVLVRRRWSPLRRSDLAIALFAGCLDVSGTAVFIRAAQSGRLDSVVVLSSLYPALTVLLARVFLKEKFTPLKTAGILTALLAVPLIALQ